MVKQLKPIELFLTLGLVATLGACASPSTNTGAGEGGEAANETTSTPASTEGTSVEGGEGGEDGESTPASAEGTSAEGGEGGEGGESASTGE